MLWVRSSEGLGETGVLDGSPNHDAGMTLWTAVADAADVDENPALNGAHMDVDGIPALELVVMLMFDGNPTLELVVVVVVVLVLAAAAVDLDENPGLDGVPVAVDRNPSLDVVHEDACGNPILDTVDVAAQPGLGAVAEALAMVDVTNLSLEDEAVDEDKNMRKWLHGCQVQGFLDENFKDDSGKGKESTS
ncbi:hypothetical protein RJ641_002735 [Dillenia turbinata]|uniref:Uncharacterized protein n=1 Tax=Dillenia turbinata TaxID=194707 RepID=A0AAN8VPA7_9MAGN